MGANYPGNADWDRCDGDYTTSPDGLIITIPAAPVGNIMTPWHPGPLVSFSKAGTAGGQRVRSNAGLPLARRDQAPILPGSTEWGAFFKSGLATQPDTQSIWTPHQAAPYTSTANSLLSVTSSAGGFSWWSAPAYTTGCKLLVTYWRWGRMASHNTKQAVWSAVPYAGQSETIWQLYGPGLGTAGRVWAQTLGDYVPGLTMAVNDIWDVWLMTRTDGTTVISTEFLSRKAGTVGGALTSKTDMRDVISYGTFPGIVAGAATNALYFGDTYGSGTTGVYWGDVAGCGLPGVDQFGWEVLGSQTRSQFYVQVDLGNSGTLTGLIVATNTTVPTAPVSVTATAVGTDIEASWPAVTGCTYTAQLHNGTSVVATKFLLDLACAFGSPGNGTYTVRVTAITAANLASATYTASVPVVLPAIIATVAVTITPSTVTPGNTAAASAVLTGGAVATLAGSSWDGSSTVVVTGVANGTTPPGAVVIANAIGPVSPGLNYIGGIMRINAVTPGSAALNQVTLEKSTTASGPFATDATQTVNPILYSALTFGSGYATNHGWAFVAATWYRVKVTDVDGRASYSPAILASPQTDYECTVTGQLAPYWGTGIYVGAVVKATLSAVTATGAQEYPKPIPPATISVLGAWTMPGLPRGATVEFLFPSGDKATHVIPASATATYEALP